MQEPYNKGIRKLKQRIRSTIYLCSKSIRRELHAFRKCRKCYYAKKLKDTKINKQKFSRDTGVKMLGGYAVNAANGLQQMATYIERVCSSFR
jgi:hypothetical protein